MSWRGAALGRCGEQHPLLGLAGTAGGVPGPPSRGADLPACVWVISVRCARGCWVVSLLRPLC